MIYFLIWLFLFLFYAACSISGYVEDKKTYGKVTISLTTIIKHLFAASTFVAPFLIFCLMVFFSIDAFISWVSEKKFTF